MTEHDSSLDPMGGGRVPGQRTSYRSAQVSSVISRAVQMEILRGIVDPRVRGLITVLGTDLSSDLEDASVRISVLPGEYGVLAVQALNHAHGHFQKTLLKQTRMRRVPRIRFVLDETLKRAAAVDLALRQAAGADDVAEPQDNPSDPHSESPRED
ncbi:MAG: 30S ribosome-binding factor RbfA [Phycisphaerae bacterium]|nr:30S ribosome-binding factor RbfA [Phycisphaerae bacterium]